jgi:hypothetical protein
MFDLVEKVVFHPICQKSFDRRGVIAAFHLRDIPNKEYLYTNSAILVRRIIGLLHSNYIDMNWSDPEIVRSYAMGEAQDCWVDRSIIDSLVLEVRHKYWGDSQIKTFCELVAVLGELHHWQIIDNR